MMSSTIDLTTPLQENDMYLYICICRYIHLDLSNTWELSDFPSALAPKASTFKSCFGALYGAAASSAGFFAW